MAKPLILLPAVDVKEGKAVRLSSAGESSHGAAIDVAREFQDRGAQWIHLVDLDAAFDRGHNRDVIAKTIQMLDIPVQLSGGIIDEESLSWALSTGSARVNLGSASLLDPTWVADAVNRFGDRVAISLDVKGERVVARGSQRDVGLVDDVLDLVKNVSTLVVTDNERDGSLQGFNMELLAKVHSSTHAAVIASGGITSLEEIDRLRELGLDGAIIGKALYAGVFTLEAALERAVK